MFKVEGVFVLTEVFPTPVYLDWIIHTHTHTHTHTNTNTHTHTHTHTHTYIYICVCNLSVSLSVYIYIYIHMIWFEWESWWRQLHNTAASCNEQILEATSHKHQLYIHRHSISITIQVRRTRHTGHCWRSKNKLISELFLWTPSHWRASVGRRVELT